MEKLRERFVEDGNRYSALWKHKTIGHLEKVCIKANQMGITTFILNPMLIGNHPLESFDARSLKFLIPVIYSLDVYKLYSIAEDYFNELSIVGLSRCKLLGSRGIAITYMEEHIAHCFPYREQQFDLNEPIVSKEGTLTRLSNKYYLPLIYRVLEECNATREMYPSDILFEAERQWSKHIKENMILHLRMGKKQPLLELAEKKRFALTSTTAALIELNTPLEQLPYPVEIICANFDKLREELKDEYDFKEENIRTLNLFHPSGSHYIGVLQAIANDKLALIAYGTPSFSPLGVTRGDKYWITSPFATMMHLLFSAWLLERRGIQRSRMIYTLYKSYRKQPKIREKYTIVGQLSGWVSSYFRQSDPCKV